MPVVDLPWGAWYGDRKHWLPLPDHFAVDILRPAEWPLCAPNAVDQVLDAPLGTRPLDELAKGKEKVCLVVDDLARPTPADVILPAILQRLHNAGIKDENISIVVATGSHGPLERAQIARKVGAEIAARYAVSCHDCRGDLAATGIPYGDRELLINREFHRADLKIAVGSVLPHPFAGYSGGAKIVIPGLVDLSAVARSHKFVQLGLRGGADPNQNRFRTEAETLARQLGLEFTVCTVTNDQRELIGLTAGDLVTAHRRGCELASSAYRTEAAVQYDGVIVNAYPKDVDLVQSEGALLPLKSCLNDLVAEDGVVILTTAASSGVGRHGLFEPGGVSFQPPRKKPILRERELWIYAPSLTTADVRQLYWEGYPVFHDGDALRAALSERYPDSATLVVLPAAPIQQVCMTSSAGRSQSGVGAAT